jgi:hypothetical protein
MSATNFLDNVLERNGDYAVYGKALGDKMRQGVEYGTNPWPKAQEAIPGITGANDPYLEDRTNRIAELDKKIADLKNRIANWDGEGAIARYKFVYENDPSAYLTRFQNLRTHEQAKELADINHKNAMELQKESQKRTDTQQKMDAWKQSSIEMDEARYNVNYWQQKANEALNARDRSRYEEAVIELKRANAKLKRASRNSESLEKQMSAHFGLDNAQEGNAPVNFNVDQNDPNIAGIDRFHALNKRLNDIDLSFGSQPLDYKKQMLPKINETELLLGQLRNEIESTVTNEKDKDDLLKGVRDKQAELDRFKTPAKYGGPKRKMQPGDWLKATTGKTKLQLEAMGTEFLKQAWRDGNKEENLKAVLIKKGVNPDVL